MNIAIVGSQHYNDYYDFASIIDDILIEYCRNTSIKIVSGDRIGTDELVKIYAKDNNIGITIIKDRFNKYGKITGSIRNAIIVKRSYIIVVFLDSNSRDMVDIINKSQRWGRKCIMVHI